MKRYVGICQDPGQVVVIDERGRYLLNGHHDIRNHSPSGFNWGYGGSGPAQLALAILADFLGPIPIPEICPYCEQPMQADGTCSAHPSSCGYDFNKEDKWKNIQGQCVHYQDFKREVIAHLPRERFELTSNDIERWVNTHRRR